MSEQRTPPFRTDDSSSNDATPTDVLRALLERAELSQRGAARLLGIDERTMRMWCTGQGVAPASVYRALAPRLTDSEHLRYRIDENERMIELFESGRSSELPRAYQPRDVEATKREIARLRKLNEEYRSMLQWEEALERMRDATAEVFMQSLTPGGFGLTLAHIQALDKAKQDFQLATLPVDHITERIRARHPLGALRGKSDQSPR